MLYWNALCHRVGISCGGDISHLAARSTVSLCFRKTGHRRWRPSAIFFFIVSWFWTFRGCPSVEERATACEPQPRLRALLGRGAYSGSVPQGGTKNVLQMPLCKPAGCYSGGSAVRVIYDTRPCGSVASKQAKPRSVAFVLFSFMVRVRVFCPSSGCSGGCARYLRSPE